MPSLPEFWVLKKRTKLRFSVDRIRSRELLPGAEQLLCAILRKDRNETALLMQRYEESAADFCALAEKNRFASLVADHLLEMDPAGTELARRIFSRLTSAAASELAIELKVCRQMTSLIRVLRTVRDKVIWIRGAALARTVYAQAHFRQFGDFDLVVDKTAFVEVVALLQDAGWSTILVPEYCHQSGVGPIENAHDLLMAPDDRWVSTSPLTLERSDWPSIDLKLSPVDNGMVLVHPARFFSEAVWSEVSGEKFLTPGAAHNLMLSAHNAMRDGFSKYKTLFDMHLIALSMADAPEQWQEFVELCRDEGTIRSAAAALLLVESRFETPVPTAVFKQLSIDRKRRRRALLFWETDQFCWNSNGLPMLLLSALTGENRKRKVDMLTRSWLPGLKF